MSIHFRRDYSRQNESAFPPPTEFAPPPPIVRSRKDHAFVFAVVRFGKAITGAKKLRNSGASRERPTGVRLCETVASFSAGEISNAGIRLAQHPPAPPKAYASGCFLADKMVRAARFELCSLNAALCLQGLVPEALPAQQPVDLLLPEIPDQRFVIHLRNALRIALEETTP